jgi:hypothetical protein
MRRAAWDVHARVKDMDLDGIWASLCFPSGAWGFTGRALSMNNMTRRSASPPSGPGTAG